MGVEKAEGDVSFAGVLPVSIGFGESAVQGAIAAAPKGKLVGPESAKKPQALPYPAATRATANSTNKRTAGNRFPTVPLSPMLQDDKQSYLMAVAVADVYGDYMPWYRLRGIDGIIYGCNFVIGNGSLAVVNLVDIGNSLSLHGVGENECSANCSACCGKQRQCSPLGYPRRSSAHIPRRTRCGTGRCDGSGQRHLYHCQAYLYFGGHRQHQYIDAAGNRRNQP